MVEMTEEQDRSMLRLARIPIRWSHLIDENTRQFMNVEHILVGKVGPLFRNML